VGEAESAGALPWPYVTDLQIFAVFWNQIGMRGVAKIGRQGTCARLQIVADLARAAPRVAPFHCTSLQIVADFTARRHGRARTRPAEPIRQRQRHRLGAHRRNRPEVTNMPQFRSAAIRARMASPCRCRASSAAPAWSRCWSRSSPPKRAGPEKSAQILRAALKRVESRDGNPTSDIRRRGGRSRVRESTKSSFTAAESQFMPECTGWGLAEPARRARVVLTSMPNRSTAHV
jgi:hypothetical protein